MSRPDLLFFRFCFLFFSSRRRRESIFFIFMRRFVYVYAFYLYFSQTVPALAPLSVSPPLRASRQLPHGGSQVTIVNSGKVGGKAKKQESLHHRKVSLCLRAYLGSPLRGSWRDAPERGENHKKKSARFHGRSQPAFWPGFGNCIIFVKKKILGRVFQFRKSTSSPRRRGKTCTWRPSRSAPDRRTAVRRLFWWVLQ